MSILDRRWFALLLAHTVLMQAVTFVLRPMTSYRALELGVGDAWLGAVSASFALVPLALALPAGRAADRLGERPIMIGGGVLVLAAAGAFLLLGGSVVGLVLASLLLGTGHLLSVVGEQSMIGNSVAGERLDTAFGHYTFAASLGQTAGPALIALVGGAGTIPEAGPVFLAATVASILLLATSTLLRPSAAGVRLEHGAPAPRLASVARIPGLPRALLTSSVVLSAVDITIIYLPALGSAVGLTAGTVGVLLALRSGASMVSRLALGRMSRRLGRRPLLVWSIVASAVALAAMALPMPVIGLGAVVVIAGLGLGVGQPLTMSWLAEVAPPGLRATALSLRLTGNRLGQILLPTSAGLLASGAGVAGVFAATAAALAGVAVASAGGGVGTTALRQEAQADAAAESARDVSSSTR